MRFLLDAHISPQVAGTFAGIGGKAEVVHLRDWHGGTYVAQHGQSDLPWLRVAGKEGWIVVTNDRNTLLGELALLYQEGGDLPGFAVVGSEHQADIGWIARQLAKLEKAFSRVEPANVQVFL
jgi:predicted nuclease of predicted toxin-antitoxin system